MSLNFQSDLLIFMILDDTFSPILQLTDFLTAKRLIRLSIRWWIPRHSNDINVQDIQFLGQRGGGEAVGPESHTQAFS